MAPLHPLGSRLLAVGRRLWANPVALAAARALLGGLFAWSGVAKCLHFDAFLASVHAYRMLPESLASVFAHLLPWVEIMAGGYLILGLFTRWAAGVIALSLVSFIIAIVVVLIRGDAIDCGCFVGGRSEPVGPQKLLEDVALLLLSLWLAWGPSDPWRLDRWLKGSDSNPTA